MIQGLQHFLHLSRLTLKLCQSIIVVTVLLLKQLDQTSVSSLVVLLPCEFVENHVGRHGSSHAQLRYLWRLPRLARLHLLAILSAATQLWPLR